MPKGQSWGGKGSGRLVPHEVVPETPEMYTDVGCVWKNIHHSATWGEIPGSNGLARLALTDEDRQVRDFFVAEARKIGADVSIDCMGNIFAILHGESNDIPPIGMGSHLDTQPAGGRYDGILGVFGALEVLRTIKRAGVKTYAPLAAINWTNEEGPRFWPGCSGSAVWAAHTPIQQAHGLVDSVSGRTMVSELARIGYGGSIPADHQKNALSAHFELHIEQRRLLQDSGRKIGVVTSIQGIRWYQVSIRGQRAHAGSTPMKDRADALVNASKVVLFLETRAREASAVATVGVLEIERPSSNTIPGRVSFTIDLRHPSEAVLDEVEQALEQHIQVMATVNDKISCQMTRSWASPAVQFDETAVSCTRSAAVRWAGRDYVMDTVSLAGHDSALTATRVPTSMIFVPSKDGISHAPEEFTSKEDW